MQWCLLAEINEAEALGELRNKLLESVLISILVIMMVFIRLSSHFIRKIVEQARKVRKKKEKRE